MNLYIAIGISIFIHAIVLYSLPYTKKIDHKILLQKGESIPKLSLNLLKEEKNIAQKHKSKNSDNSSDVPEKSNSTQSPSTEGNKELEIVKIKNKILYPELAREQGWESECEWLISVKNNQFSNYRTLKKCKYRIFEEEFLRVVRSWEFGLKEGELIIPVRFTLKTKDE